MQRHQKKLGFTFLAALLLLVTQPWVAWGDDPKIKKKMNQWKGELGVKCDYCHVVKGRKFDYEAKTPRKEVAHYCEENFVKKLMGAGNKKLSCVDCHQGKPRFLPHPPGEQQQGTPPVAGGEEGGDKGAESGEKDEKGGEKEHEDEDDDEHEHEGGKR